MVVAISIHAPTKGATNDQKERFKKDISIHAPTKGATNVSDEIDQIMKISIHAPTMSIPGDSEPPFR